MAAKIQTAYQAQVRAGILSADSGQAGAVTALGRLEKELKGLGGLFGKKSARGLYLWGQPGRGKSMLMDLFFAHAPIKVRQRWHFHAFMAEVHALVKQWREASPAERRRQFGRYREDDPIAPVADHLAARAKLLCFDELQVTDIADAMILGRLFDALFERGVVLVATSNRHPTELYKNGLNRQLFEPFIVRIQQACVVHEIVGPRDFRLDRLRGTDVYFQPMDQRAGFEALWAAMLGPMQENGALIEVLERTLRFERAAGPLLRVGFAEVCDVPLGAQDYLALAERFTTIFLDGVPVMTPDKRNVAKRFVTLIDALYEAGTKLVVLADAPPEQLYPAGDGAFEFERTVSRLNEMRSKAYLERHQTDTPSI
ncbi:MAG: cell division protein ZapE [Asticcacaulis sp.]